MYDASRRLLCEGWGGEAGRGSSISEGTEVEVDVEATGALGTSVLGENENSVQKVKDIGWLASAVPSGDGRGERSGGSSREDVGMPCSYLVCVRTGGMWGSSDGRPKGNRSLTRARLYWQRFGDVKRRKE